MDDNAETVEVVEDVVPVETEVTEEVAEQVETPAEEQKPEKTFTQADIDRAIEKRLGRERAKYERETEQLRQIALQRGEQRQEPMAVQQAEQPPHPDQFAGGEYDPEYFKAIAKYEARQELQQQLTQHNQRLDQERAQAAQQQTVDSWNKKVAKATAELPDLADVVGSSSVPMPDHVKAMVMQSDIGPKLAYYLASHPDEAEQIATQQPLAAIRSLVRIEDKLSEAPLVKKATDAAAPITPVGAKSKSEKALEDMSFAEFTEHRRKQIAARR